MDFSQVKYFVAISETLNFTRAAEKCHVSQPALTQAIKRLEEELGGKLIARDGRNTELTKLGRALRSKFEQIAQTRELVRATAKALTSGEIADLNIGIMCTIGPKIISKIIDCFQEENPNVSLILHDITHDEVSNLLLSGILDGAFFAHDGTQDTNFNYIKLFEEEMVVAFNKQHRFKDSETLSLEEIGEQKYLDRLHCEFRNNLFNYFQDKDVNLNIVVNSQREDWIQSMVNDGMGVCILPRYSITNPELEIRPINGENTVRHVEFITLRDNERSGPLEALMRLISIKNWYIEG